MKERDYSKIKSVIVQIKSYESTLNSLEKIKEKRVSLQCADGYSICIIDDESAKRIYLFNGQNQLSHKDRRPKKTIRGTNEMKHKLTPKQEQAILKVITERMWQYEDFIETGKEVFTGCLICSAILRKAVPRLVNEAKPACGLCPISPCQLSSFRSTALNKTADKRKRKTAAKGRLKEMEADLESNGYEYV